MDMPDIEGFTLGRALKVLENGGNAGFKVVVTGPPWVEEKKLNDCYRVVRVRAVNEDELELTVCDPQD